MTRKVDEKKVVETRVLKVARTLGVPIPLNEIPGEEPDFTFQHRTWPAGYRVRELLRPASSNHGIVPVAEEAFHIEVVQGAKKLYYENPDAVPTTIRVYSLSQEVNEATRKRWRAH